MKIHKSYIKRIFDFMSAFLGILIFLPIFFVVSVLIFFNLGRPIFFKQPRAGIHGKVFNVYKFRTMTNECDETGSLLPDKDRLKSFGKFLRSTSIDELPSLLNVLNGTMSIVGPRPFMAEYLPLYSNKQARRHDVRPGITGWAQVNGRNSITWNEKFEMDLWYLDNQSFLLDLKIIWLTIKKVVMRDGISNSDNITMDKFKGT